MVPHGDRKDRAESRCVEDDERGCIHTEDDVVRVLILRDRLKRNDPWLSRARPPKRFVKSLQFMGSSNEVTHGEQIMVVSVGAP